MNPLLAKMIALFATSGLTLGRASTDDDAIEVTREFVGKTKLQLEAGADATKGLQAVMSALGVEDIPGATKKISEMLNNSAALLAAMPELEALRAAKGDSEDESAAEDVDETVKAYRVDDALKPALTFMRTGGVEIPKDKDAKDFGARLTVALTRRAEAKAKFFGAYPKLTPTQTQLTRVQGVSTLTAPVKKTTKALTKSEDEVTDLINLDEYEGANRFERGMNACIALDKAAGGKLASLPRDQRFKATREFLKRPEVVGGD